MADKTKAKDIVGRIYNIPLRKEFRKAPKYKRANKAIRAIRKFLERHVKQDVKIGKYLNQKILEHGRKNIPHHVEVKITKESRGEKEKKVEYWLAELVGAPIKKKVEEKGKLKKVKEKIKEEILGKEVKTEKEEKEEILKEKSKDLAEKKKHHPKLKEGKLATAPTRDLERRDIVSKPEKPSHETRLSKK